MPGQILLVEDDEALVTILARHLRARGHDVRAVESAEDAIAALGTGDRPALVLLDINLPEDSGWGVLRSEAYRAAGAPPVVLVTATHVSPERLHEFPLAGYLPKPFALETLMSTVERITGEPAEGEASMPARPGIGSETSTAERRGPAAHTPAGSTTEDPDRA